MTSYANHPFPAAGQFTVCGTESKQTSYSDGDEGTCWWTIIELYGREEVRIRQSLSEGLINS